MLRRPRGKQHGLTRGTAACLPAFLACRPNVSLEGSASQSSYNAGIYAPAARGRSCRACPPSRSTSRTPRTAAASPCCAAAAPWSRLINAAPQLTAFSFLLQVVSLSTRYLPLLLRTSIWRTLTSELLELLRNALALDGSLGSTSNRLLLRTGVHCATALVVGAQLESRFGRELDPSYRDAMVRTLRKHGEVPRFTSADLEAHGAGEVEPEEVVRRLNRKPVLVRDEAGASVRHQLRVGFSPSLEGPRGFKQLCDDCRRRAGLGNVAVVVVKCAALDGRHAVAAFEVTGERFRTVLAENSLGDTFYVTEQNYVRHLTLDVTIAATFDAEGVPSDWSPPELLSYADTEQRNRKREEALTNGLGAGEELRQKNLALKAQREARAAAVMAKRALLQKQFVESNIKRRQGLLRHVIHSAATSNAAAIAAPPPPPPPSSASTSASTSASLHSILAALPLSRSSSSLGMYGTGGDDGQRFSGSSSLSLSQSDSDLGTRSTRGRSRSRSRSWDRSQSRSSLGQAEPMVLPSSPSPWTMQQ